MAIPKSTIITLSSDGQAPNLKTATEIPSLIPFSTDELHQNTPTTTTEQLNKPTKLKFNEEKRLLNILMEGYDRNVRPVGNSSAAILIELGITLTQIFDMVRFLLFYCSVDSGIVT